MQNTIIDERKELAASNPAIKKAYLRCAREAKEDGLLSPAAYLDYTQQLGLTEADLRKHNLLP